MGIREASKDDAKNICKLVTSLSRYYLDEGQSDFPEWFLSTLRVNEFENRLKSAEYYNLVYEVENHIVGYISMNENGHLYHLFVSEQYQGNGIARQLWNQITRKCKSSKYTVQSSMYAIPVYKAFGFNEAGPAGVKGGIHFQPMELVS